MRADTFRKRLTRRSPNAHRAMGLRQKTYMLFLVAAAIVLGAGVYAIDQTGSQTTRDRLIRDLTTTLSAEESQRVNTTAIVESVRRVQQHLMVATAAVLVVMLALVLAFIKKVIKPIDQVGEAADRIAKGQLGALAPIDDNGEVGKIAEHINDMAMNLQEILLMVWNHTGRNRQRLELMTEMLRQHSNGDSLPDEFVERLRVLSTEVEDLQRFVEAFDYYDVRLTCGKTLAASDRETPVPS
ncbi:hypothetical protein D3OALGA1CA_2271 [Olavius algarvensis associated proteobacterium Delta 3]|nr:hypothetical protein D3OALGA1CA_2271 [Olavius algarvensis associated proteobacterium Delta 3]CAB5165408.1 hypothetical protein D3OALGB2SA_5714 [Olavius algarvensis associated proteobacterium Delta 3]